jgi:hypothetical protein
MSIMRFVNNVFQLLNLYSYWFVHVFWWLALIYNSFIYQNNARVFLVSVELDSLREQAEKLRGGRNVDTGLRLYNMPTLKGIAYIFEGFQSMDDTICFE